MVGTITDLFTASYPRSGSTWLTRLLSTMLDAPIQVPVVGAPIDVEHCETCAGDYIVRKTHWQVHEWNGSGKLIFIQRDPRDVAISAMFYLNLAPTAANLSLVLRGMLEPYATSERCYQIYWRQGPGGDYQRFVEGWLRCPNVLHLRYEELHREPEHQVRHIYRWLTGETLTARQSNAVVRDNTFAHWQGKHPHSLRCGTVGEHKKYFGPEHHALIHDVLSAFMQEQGYV